MRTGYGRRLERFKADMCDAILGARHEPEAERLCGGLVYLGRYNKCSALPFLPLSEITTMVR